jgi:hypothetical protein
VDSWGNGRHVWGGGGRSGNEPENGGLRNEGSSSLRWIPGDPTSKIGVRIIPNNYTLAD